MAKKYHPDTSKEKDASAKFVEVQEAYELLSDESKRQMYDNYGHEQNQNFSSDSHESHFNQGFGGENPFSGFGGFRDFFSNFGGMERERNLDAKVTVNLSFLEACLGTEKNISYSRTIDCDSCGGSGREKSASSTKCSGCRGKGYERIARGGVHIEMLCRKCKGTGNTAPSCKKCSGSGEMTVKANCELYFPPGTRDDIVYLKEMAGNRVGGNVGSLAISVKIEQSPIGFTRKGNDIFLSIDLPLKTALLGGKLIVPTIWGEVEVSVPSGVSLKQPKKLTGKGIPGKSLSAKGDMYITYYVKFPELSAKQKELIEKVLDGKGFVFSKS